MQEPLEVQTEESSVTLGEQRKESLSPSNHDEESSEAPRLAITVPSSSSTSPPAEPPPAVTLSVPESAHPTLYTPTPTPSVQPVTLEPYHAPQYPTQKAGAATTLAVPTMPMIKVSGPPSRKVSQQPSGISSVTTSLRVSPSLAIPPGPATAASILTVPGMRPRNSRSPRSLRSRSIMSMGTGSGRISRTSTASKLTPADLGLSPGLQELIGRLADVKDVHQIRHDVTDQLEPHRPFNFDKVSTLLRTALETGLLDATYSDQWAGDACRILAAYIINSVKKMGFSRCKIAAKVTVMERHAQGVHMVMRALWDCERDNYCAAQIMTTTLIGVAVVFVTYWD